MGRPFPDTVSGEESRGSGLFGFFFFSSLFSDFFGRSGSGFDFIFVVEIVLFAADGAAEKFLLFRFIRAAGDVHGDVHRDFRVQHDADFLEAEDFQRTVKNDLTLADGDAFGGCRFGNVTGRDRAIKLTAVAGGPDNRNHQAVELLGNLFGFGLTVEVFRFELGALAFEVGQVALVRTQGFTLGRDVRYAPEE